MADDSSALPSPFDVKTIKDLAALMSRHDLSEIDLQEGVRHLRLRRGLRGKVTVTPASLPLAAPQALPAPAASNKVEEPAKPAKPQAAIKSPTPGTFYSSASPDTPPFVRVGSKVTPTTIVCIIEAMKIFNEIQAECAGVITEVLVENQQPVEYGQVLFKVDPTG